MSMESGSGVRGRRAPSGQMRGARGEALDPRPSTPGPLNDYLNHLAKERDVSPHTIKAYTRDLDAFVAFLSGY